MRPFSIPFWTTAGTPPPTRTTSTPRPTTCWDTRRSGNTCTVYLPIAFGSYDLTEAGYALQTSGEDPAALTFAAINGLYQLTEYWTPGGGAHYETDLRTVFPTEAAEAVLARTGWKDLSARLDTAAEEQYLALLEETDYRSRAAQCGIHRSGAGHHARRDDLCPAAGLVPGQPAAGGRLSLLRPDLPGRQHLSSLHRHLDLRPCGRLRSAPPSVPPLPPTAPRRTSPCLPAPPADAPRSEDILLSGDTLTYTVTFPEPQTDERSGALLHLQGTYRSPWT